jgi:hypothetical protein
MTSDLELEFKEQLKLIKKEFQDRMIKSCHKYSNVKNWKVRIEYEWSIPISTSFDDSDIIEVKR